MSELDFKGGNPGAVQYGNFINYYQFHPPENRLKLLPDHLWPQKKHLYALDIGCNAGDLTISLHNYFKEKSQCCDILGVDIDPTLIERCKEKAQKNGNLEFHCLNFMNDPQDLVRQYLKQRNLTQFDIVFCFSITMWIHLNNGDDGLVNFLTEIQKLGDLIVIEPQPWKCYKSAVKRMKGSNSNFPFYPSIKIKNMEDFIDTRLVQFCNCVKVYESPRSDWERKLCIFKKQIT